MDGQHFPDPCRGSVPDIAGDAPKHCDIRWTQDGRRRTILVRREHCEACIMDALATADHEGVAVTLKTDDGG